MELTEEDILSFIDMWKKAFGESLTRDQARYEAKRVLDFYLTLAAARLEDSSGRCDTIAV